MESLEIKIGARISYRGEVFTIKRFVDLYSVIGENKKGDIEKLDIKLMEPYVKPSADKADNQNTSDLLAFSDQQWAEAQNRFSFIKPIIENPRNGELVDKLAKESGKNKATLYRWVKRYEETGLISSLVQREKDGGKGKSRLEEDVELILRETIKEVYKTKAKHKVGFVAKEVEMRCRVAQLKTPHINTIRNRILDISEEERIRYRHGNQSANERFNPVIGKFPNADFPLSVVQIDHTKSDIILVDEETRTPIGRPWITLAIDVYSRMVVGMNVSLDPPGAMGTGLCLSNAILPKEKTLSEFNINAQWPCWGIMNTVHADNAGEFRGKMLRRACEEYGINLEWRPVKKPHYGGHIERLMGTLNELVHNLPGTTFSNKEDKKEYDSVAKASISLREFEEMLLVFILEIYHKRYHKGINTTPLEKLNEGLFGNSQVPGRGFPARILDDKKLKLDFMPYFERTIQEYGVKIDHVDYYHDVLRKWIHSIETEQKKYKVKRLFIFKRDPRDISQIYFWDPELKEYFNIPYRNISRPSISIWEFRKALKAAKSEGMDKVDEEAIFQSYEKLRAIRDKAIHKSLSAKRNKLTPGLKEMKRKQEKIYLENKDFEASIPPISTSKIKFKPFEDLDHGTSI